MSRLLIARGPSTGVSYELGDRTRIGRLGENEIQLPDPNVSRIHAEITRDGDRYVIVDRGSKNGIIVNGAPTAEHTLQPGDQVTIGAVTFAYNSPLEIRNARHSCTHVYFLPVLEETEAPVSGQPAHSVNCSDAMQGLAKILAGSQRSLTSITDPICEHTRELLDADQVLLFLRDYPGGRLHPVNASPGDDAAYMGQGFIERCDAEEKAGAYSLTLDASALADLAVAADVPFETTQPLPGRADSKSKSNDTGYSPVFVAELAPEPDHAAEIDNENHMNYTYLCAPVGIPVQGVLVAVKRNGSGWSPDALGSLQAIAALTALPVIAARSAAVRDGMPEADTHLDVEQRTSATRSLRMQEIYNSARRSAEGNAPILLTGETGTGKETLARYIHECSSRSSAPFIVVRCSSIPEEKLEQELFGWREVADDGSVITHAGRVEYAMGGTLMLEEVSALSLAFQPKLLRFIQDRAYYRVGSHCAIEADLKLIASTSVDLAAAVRSGNFREDLWYRLNVVPFHIPPLRERREDIAPLMDFFVQLHARRLNRHVIGTNDGSVALLQKYDWPGNIRELNNAAERAVLLAEGKVLSTSDFSHIEEARRQLNAKSDLERKRDTRPLAEVERQHIIVALKKHNFNQARAAEALGLHRNTLRNKIIEYGIEIPK